MAMERVGWELVQGVQSLSNLMSMVEDALLSKEVRGQKLAGANWNGFDFYINKKRCWCGVLYSKPQVLLFEAYDVSESDAESVGIGEYLDKEASEAYGRYEKQSASKWRHKLELDSEEVHFFALSSENQQKSVEEFVTKGISAVKKISPIAAAAGV